MEAGRRIVLDRSFHRALVETLNAISDEHLDVVSGLDLESYFEHKLHHDFRCYTILQVVSPQAALDALREDLTAGPLLMTAFAIFELADGETAVVVAEPFERLSSCAEWRRANPAMAAVADRLCESVARVLERLTHVGQHSDGVAPEALCHSTAT